jgi:hypothetical protein
VSRPPAAPRAARWVLAAALAAAAPATRAGEPASDFALRFRGTGTDQKDRIRIRIDDDAPGPDASAPADVGKGSFTIELWLKGARADNGTPSAGGDREFADFRWIDGNIIVDRDIWGGSDADWGISIAGGFIRFGTGSGDVDRDGENTIEGDVDVLDGAWHHVACVRDATSGVKSVYVDGVLDFSSSPGASRADLSYPDGGVPGQATSWGPFIVIAAEKHDAGPAYPSFDGFVDEVRIWSTARTGEEIAAARALVVDGDSPGLVAHYRFEEGSGTTVADSSAAGSPAGELMAGVAGNGEWVARADDPGNTAPVMDGGPVTVRGWRRCDVNCDGAQDVADAIAGFGFLFQEGGPPCCGEAADCNGDGAGDVSDGIALLLHLFAGREPPPPPFAECGAPGGAGCDAYPHCPDLPAG